MDLRIPASLGPAASMRLIRTRLRSGGFDRVHVAPVRSGWIRVRARRAFTLPDWVVPDLRLLVCGLNPSLRAAETGIPFGGPGNRFWPAARAAGLVGRERDVVAALESGVGFTDLVKRSTRGSDEVTTREFRRGLGRLEDLVSTFSPSVVCFVGLEGWRRAVDRGGRPGWIAGGMGGSAAYLMPSTSGRNAGASLSTLRDHLQRARRPPGSALPPRPIA